MSKTKIIEALRKGLSVSDISKKYGVSTQWIYQVRKEDMLKSKGYPYGKVLELKREQRDMKIHQLYIEGLTYEEISKKTNVGKTTVVNVITALKEKGEIYPRRLSTEDKAERDKNILEDSKTMSYNEMSKKYNLSKPMLSVVLKEQRK